MGSRRRRAAGQAGRARDAAPAEAQRAERLVQAQHAHRQGRLDDAERAYRSVLSEDPANGDALHFLGVLMHQRGDDGAAVDLIRRAIAVIPDSPHAHNNLGNVLLEAHRPDEAIDAFRACLAVAPDYARAHSNLGAALARRGETAAAEAEYRKAIEADPGLIEAYDNLSNLLLSQRRTEEAAVLASQATIRDPRNARSLRLLGAAHEILGDVEKAASVYRDWLASDPDNPVALHHLAAVTGADAPARASDAYVEATFDAFAASFDTNLQNLDYRVPELIAHAIRDAVGEPRADRSILDAGCGTGLCGPLVRGWAKHLTGIDLSAGMLSRAARRRAYDALEKGEIEAWLSATGKRWDIILSADTLCYFGELSAVVRAAHRALREGGLFVFSLEDLESGTGAPYQLRAGGRYAHTRSCVESVLGEAGFASTAIETARLRFEAGRPVTGWIVRATS